MALISVQNLTFSYETSYDNIFEQVSFDIDTKWKLGLIGRNGKGKTTFLKLLKGDYHYKGHIHSPKFFEYFPYEVKNKEKNTIDCIEDIHPEYEFWAVCKELNLLQVDLDVLYRPFETLSHGEQVKIMLGVLFAKENTYLLIDEPTNHLDVKGRQLLMSYLNKKNSFMVISHDRKFLDGCIDHVLSINKNTIEVQKGNFSSWYENKKRRDEYKLAENKKASQEIQRLSKTARTKSQWSDQIEKSKKGDGHVDKGYVGAKSAKMMKKAKVVEKRMNKKIEDKQKLLKDIDDNQPIKIHYKPFVQNRLGELSNLVIHYNDKQIFRPIEFEINRGDRIALCGPNGCGKSSIIKLILGENIGFTGAMRLSPQVKISYVSQKTQHLKGGLKEFCVEHGIQESLFKTILRKFGFERIQFDKKIEEFSEGQKKKVLLAKSLSEEANLYIWDEPLNYIDVLTRIQIEEVIEKYQPTLLFVEHDQQFIESIATKSIKID